MFPTDQIPSQSPASEALRVAGYTGGFVATNGYLAEWDGGKVMVDAPAGATQWLRERGIGRLDGVMLTHQHFDHIEDAALLAEAFSCQIYAFSPYERSLTLEDMLGGFAGMSFEIRPYTIDSLLEGAGEVQVAGRRFDLLHVPGHSPDSLCFFDRDSQSLFGGDVLMAGGIGRSDFPGGDGDLLGRGIREKIYPLGDGVVVYPGHGPATTVGEERRSNPFVRG